MKRIVCVYCGAWVAEDRLSGEFCTCTPESVREANAKAASASPFMRAMSALGAFDA